MNSLLLYFSGSETPQLQEAIFSHPLLPIPRHSIRGKGLSSSSLSFQWTTALQALCLLMLRYKRQGSAAKLEGARNTPAASLDYSLSKRTQWLKDMFGVDKRGELIALRVLKRTNTECRRGPTVCLQVNHLALSSIKVQVFINQMEVDAPYRLFELEKAIEKIWRPKPLHLSVVHKETPQQSQSKDTGLTRYLAQMMESEVASMLNHTNIFQRPSLISALNALAKHPSVLKVTKDPLQFTSNLDLELSGSQRLGLDADRQIESVLKSGSPLRVALSGTTAGAMAIFTYLQKIKGYNFDISYQYPHAIEIKKRIMSHSFSEPPHLCGLGCAPAASLMTSGQRSGYKPLMLLPSMSHAVVESCHSPTANFNQLNGEILLLSEEPSTSLFFLDDLKQRNVCSQHNVFTSNKEPDEVAAQLSSANPDQRAILYFPYYSLNQLFNDCQLVASTPEPVNVKESVLLAHESIASNSQLLKCINIAIRDAWFELQHNQVMRERVIKMLLKDQTYVQFLFRTAGMAFMRKAPNMEQLAA